MNDRKHSYLVKLCLSFVRLAWCVWFHSRTKSPRVHSHTHVLGVIMLAYNNHNVSFLATGKKRSQMIIDRTEPHQIICLNICQIEIKKNEQSMMPSYSPLSPVFWHCITNTLNSEWACSPSSEAKWVSAMRIRNTLSQTRDFRFAENIFSRSFTAVTPNRERVIDDDDGKNCDRARSTWRYHSWKWSNMYNFDHFRAVWVRFIGTWRQSKM